MRLLHLLTGSLANSSWANCSSCLKFNGCFLQTASCSSFHRYSIGFREGLIEDHFRTVQCFVLWVLGHFPVGGPMLQNALIVFIVPCTNSRHPVPGSAKQSLNTTESPPMFHCRYDVLFFESFIFSFVNIWLMADMTCQKAPVLTHLSKGHSPRRIVAICVCAFL